jgi:hypothetical protein
MADETGGPYLQMACFCEKVLIEQDGVLSIIRVIDRIIVTASGLDSPQEMPVGQINFPVVIVLKAGFARGSHTLKLVPTSPSGKTLGETSVAVLFEGEDRGVNVILQVQLPAQEEGLYWFNVMVSDQLLTRIPFRLVYQRLAQGLLPGAR